jgi:hypothetical protein
MYQQLEAEFTDAYHSNHPILSIRSGFYYNLSRTLKIHMLKL